MSSVLNTRRIPNFAATELFSSAGFTIFEGELDAQDFSFD